MNFFNLASLDLLSSGTSPAGQTQHPLAWVLGILILLILIYAYFSLAFMHTSRKVGVKKEWQGLAWLPNAWPYFFSQMANMSWVPAVLLIVLGAVITIISIPFSIMGMILLQMNPTGATYGWLLTLISWAQNIIGILLLVYIVIWTWRICESRKRPGWWAIISVAILVIMILLGLLKIHAIWMEVIMAILFVAVILWQFIMWGILAWSK